LFYDQTTGNLLNSESLATEDAESNLYPYVGDDPIDNFDLNGLSTYSCKAPLEALGKTGGLLAYALVPKAYHQYLCVKTGNLTICNGQDRSGDAGWFDKGSSGTPSNDTWKERGGSCNKTSDKQCIDQCVTKALNDPRPQYNIRNASGSNCQKWADDVLNKCKKQCGGSF
jgi:hypothetical protein